MAGDQIFSGRAERFRDRIYGSAKGELRLELVWRDMLEHLPLQGAALDCWDAGGGTYWNEKRWQAPGPVLLDESGPDYKGEWHFVEVYVRLNSIADGIGQNDGVVQQWIDGESVFDEGGP